MWWVLGRRRLHQHLALAPGRRGRRRYETGAFVGALQHAQTGKIRATTLEMGRGILCPCTQKAPITSLRRRGLWVHLNHPLTPALPPAGQSEKWTGY